MVLLLTMKFAMEFSFCQESQDDGILIAINGSVTTNLFMMVMMMVMLPLLLMMMTMMTMITMMTIMMLENQDDGNEQE